MGEDASLDQFIGAESDEQGEESTEADVATEAEASVEGEVPEQSVPGAKPDEAAGPETEPEPDEPARTTYAWSDEGTTCKSCGETVERRWRQDDRLVCPDCKDWAQG